VLFVDQNSNELVRGDKGEVWGKVKNKIYETWRGDEHFCFKFSGYGIQKWLFDWLCDREVETIMIKTPNRIYVSGVNVWKRFGKVATLRREDGEQIFLSVKEMIRDIPKNFSRLDDFK